MASSLHSLSLAELLELCVKRNDAAAWREFVARFHGLISRVARRVATRWGEHNPAVIEELVQETYTTLIAGDSLRQLRSTQPDAVYGFIKVIATNVANDHFRARQTDKRGGGAQTLSASALEALPAGEAGPEQFHASLLLEQIESRITGSRSSPEVDRDLLIFQLHYRLGMSAQAIASIPALRLTSKGVESILARLVRLARTELAAPKPADGKKKKTQRAAKKAGPRP